MSNHEEEQALEIEALQSIFEEEKELVVISQQEFLLKLLPYPAGEQDNHVSVVLHVRYTPEYPDTAPDWSLEDIKELPDDKVDTLKSQIEEAISGSLGMAMIYTVAEAARDYLKANNFRSRSMHEEMMDRLAGRTEGGDEEDGDEDDDDDDYDDDDDAEEEEEWKGLADKELPPPELRITPEIFATWKVKFEEDMIALGVLKREEQKAKTGKQLFLESRDGAAEAAAGGRPDAGAVANGEGGLFVYDAALFGEDAADLDDLSAGEDD